MFNDFYLLVEQQPGLEEQLLRLQEKERKRKDRNRMDSIM
jgi:hypothetical protein